LDIRAKCDKFICLLQDGGIYLQYTHDNVLWILRFLLGYCIGAALDPAWEHWCANRSIETQAT